MYLYSGKFRYGSIQQEVSLWVYIADSFIVCFYSGEFRCGTV